MGILNNNNRIAIAERRKIIPKEIFLLLFPNLVWIWMKPERKINNNQHNNNK